VRLLAKWRLTSIVGFDIFAMTILLLHSLGGGSLGIILAPKYDVTTEHNIEEVEEINLVVD